MTPTHPLYTHATTCTGHTHQPRLLSRESCRASRASVSACKPSSPPPLSLSLSLFVSLLSSPPLPLFFHSTLKPSRASSRPRLAHCRKVITRRVRLFHTHVSATGDNANFDGLEGRATGISITGRRSSLNRGNYGTVETHTAGGKRFLGSGSRTNG